MIKEDIKVKVIVAFDEERAIGKNGTLPWHIPEDLKRFSALTKGHTVLMGRTTWESLPEKYKPLPQRNNIVLSRTVSAVHPEVKVFASLEEVVIACKENTSALVPTKILWIIGGAAVYKASMHLWDEVFVTEIKGTHAGDTFFPEFDKNFILENKEQGQGCSFLHYLR